MAQHGIKEYYQNINVGDTKISMVQGAKETVENLAAKHTLAIVTFGVEAQQLQKIKSAKLNTNLFSSVNVTLWQNKDVHYQKLMQEHQITPEQTIVIGDSISRDILPAKKLGITTVHFRNSRAKHIQYTPETQPSFFIKSLNELFDIISKLAQ